MKRLIVSAWVALALSACVQTTGGELVTFAAAARGVDEARSTFVTPKGYSVTLERAQLFVGALYLNQNNPSNYAAETACVLPGLYTGEVRGALSVDALSTELQPFDVSGNGTDAQTRSFELWLTEGDINARGSTKVVLSLRGVAADSQGTRWPFSADFTIGANRATAPDEALPGSNPICKQRLVTPIPTEGTLRAGATVVLTVDARAWLSSVDFKELQADPDDATRYRFVDDTSRAGQPDRALYNGLRSTVGPYSLSF